MIFPSSSLSSSSSLQMLCRSLQHLFIFICLVGFSAARWQPTEQRDDITALTRPGWLTTRDVFPAVVTSEGTSPEPAFIFGGDLSTLIIIGAVVAALLLLIPLMVYLMVGCKGGGRSSRRRTGGGGSNRSSAAAAGSAASNSSLNSKKEPKKKKKKKKEDGEKSQSYSTSKLSKKSKKGEQKRTGKKKESAEGGNDSSEELSASGEVEASVSANAGPDFRINPPATSINAPLSTTGFLFSKHKFSHQEKPQMAPLLNVNEGSSPATPATPIVPTTPETTTSPSPS